MSEINASTGIHPRIFVISGFIMVVTASNRHLRRTDSAKPTDLPVFQSAKFELAINLKTAKILGLETAQTMLTVDADVIE